MFVTISFVFILILFVLSFITFILAKNSAARENKEFMNYKEFFLEFGIFTTLIFSISSLLEILFKAIDKQFPDILERNFYTPEYYSDWRLPIATLLIIFPIFLLLAFLRNKHYSQNPNRADISSNKFPYYFTLGVSLVFILISLIWLIYYYLGGELSTRFLLKFLVSIVVLGFIALYHYFLIKRSWTKLDRKYQYVFLSIVVLLIIFTLIYSINILGSPSYMRKVRFDDLRKEDISKIQEAIIQYWKVEKKLPEDLTKISSSVHGGLIYIKDPKTQENYEYIILQNSIIENETGDKCFNFYPDKYNNVSDINKIKCFIPSKAKFKICANFETERYYDFNGKLISKMDFEKNNVSDNLTYTYYYPGSKDPYWNHTIGKNCFERTIDPKDYN